MCSCCDFFHHQCSCYSAMYLFWCQTKLTHSFIWNGFLFLSLYTTCAIGVAVEELKQWKGRTRLKESIPIQVEKMITEHDLMDDYTRMVDEVVEAGGGSWLKGGWDLEKLKALVDKYRPIFANRGIVLHISHKEEYISHGQYGGHTEYYRWVEFVDPTKQPNYVPQRSADTKDEACSVM